MHAAVKMVTGTLAYLSMAARDAFHRQDFVQGRLFLNPNAIQNVLQQAL